MVVKTTLESMIRPEVLVEGAVYLLLESKGNCRCAPADVRPVRFAAYTSCPGVVLVAEETGQRIRCSRHKLFTNA